MQAGNGTPSTTDVPVQVDSVTCKNKSTEITPDLGTYHQKHSQTQFLCPGSEHDPYFDSYWIGRHCNNFSCRYASMYARQSTREPLYKCDLCNIVVCRNCKVESEHDDMCMQSFTLFRRNAGVNVLQIHDNDIIFYYSEIFNHVRYPELASICWLCMMEVFFFPVRPSEQRGKHQSTSFRLFASLNPARRMGCKQMERRLKFIVASKNTDLDMTKKYQSNRKIKKFAYQLIKNPK